MNYQHCVSCKVRIWKVIWSLLCITRHIAGHYRQSRMLHGDYPILRMSVNGAPMMLGFPSWGIYFPTGRWHPLMRHCQPFGAKRAATRSLPHAETERQWSVHHVWSCKSGNSKVTWESLYIMNELEAFIGRRENNTVTAPFWQWAIPEHQLYLALHRALSKWRLVADIHKCWIGCYLGY